MLWRVPGTTINVLPRGPHIVTSLPTYPSCRVVKLYITMKVSWLYDPLESTTYAGIQTQNKGHQY